METVVVATTERELAGVRARLGELGVRRVDVVAPGAARGWARAAGDEGGGAERLPAPLRAGGTWGVPRPGGGARLDAWMRSTRPITFGARLSVCFAWSE